MRLTEKIIKIVSLPKSLYVSYKLCGFKNMFKIPVLVRYNTIIRNVEGTINVKKGEIKHAIVRVGFSNGEGTLDYSCVRSVLEISGKIDISGPVSFGAGSRICVEGHLEIGSLHNSSRMHLVCLNHIKIGYNLGVGWECCIMDSDIHPLINLLTGKISNPHRTITIGDNVWLGTRCLVTKGTIISDGCIIGAKALVSGRYEHRNAIIVGNPAKVIKTGYTRYYSDGEGKEYIDKELKVL